ncbi:ribbon-helix-helix protein, CopG family [Thioalkalivibrio sp. ALE14]|uniref:type II toxin-antitoxin system RelB family antitoxin n=1 Tax=Thioalkalivibrio sp. ALE14 TaxID=1158168 RepID=UPI00035CF1B4|nr:ribbon-helix-helix protein, CopG family [Thioalkalivibrio sp. ALE14]
MTTRTGDTRQTTVRLPSETYRRLMVPADKMGRTMTDCIREAVEEHLTDLEGIDQADQTLARIRCGEESVIGSEALWRDLHG